MARLRIRTVGAALAAAVAITYTLCVLWDLLVPATAMHPAWHVLLPGFAWSRGGVALGLVELVLYSFWAAVLFVPIYNALRHREVPRDTQHAHV